MSFRHSLAYLEATAEERIEMEEIHGDFLLDLAKADHSESSDTPDLSDPNPQSP